MKRLIFVQLLTALISAEVVSADEIKFGNIKSCGVTVPGHTTLSIIPDEMNDSHSLKEACNVTADIEVPNGYTIWGVDIIHRGYESIDESHVVLGLHTRIDFAGGKHDAEYPQWYGVTDGDYFNRFNADVSSDCRSKTTLNFRTALITGQSGFDDSSLRSFYIDSIDLKFKLKRC